MNTHSFTYVRSTKELSFPNTLINGGYRDFFKDIGGDSSQYSDTIKFGHLIQWFFHIFTDLHKHHHSQF